MRNTSNAIKLPAIPHNAVMSDHRMTLAAMIFTRFIRSASRAIGIPMTVYISAKPKPDSRPNCQSCNLNSSMIGWATTPINMRSMKFNV